MRRLSIRPTVDLPVVTFVQTTILFARNVHLPMAGSEIGQQSTGRDMSEVAPIGPPANNRSGHGSVPFAESGVTDAGRVPQPAQQGAPRQSSFRLDVEGMRVSQLRSSCCSTLN